MREWVVDKKLDVEAERVGLIFDNYKAQLIATLGLDPSRFCCSTLISTFDQTRVSMMRCKL